MRVSVLIPCYNERDTLAELICRVRDSGIPDLEVVLIDDGSTDGTSEMAYGLAPGSIDKLVSHARNRGKGAAIRSGMSAMTGEVVLLQDADLEYNPRDYAKLLAPIAAGDADVVYGSRFLRGVARGAWMNRRYNRLASALIRQLTGKAITDYATGYKVFRASLLRGVQISAHGFAVDAELTLKVACRQDVRFVEVDIEYCPRMPSEGKKVRWWHGIEALAAIIRYRMTASARRRVDASR